MDEASPCPIISSTLESSYTDVDDEMIISNIYPSSNVPTLSPSFLLGSLFMQQQHLPFVMWVNKCPGHLSIQDQIRKTFIYTVHCAVLYKDQVRIIIIIIISQEREEPSSWSFQFDFLSLCCLLTRPLTQTQTQTEREASNRHKSFSSPARCKERRALLFPPPSSFLSPTFFFYLLTGEAVVVERVFSFHTEKRNVK